MLKHSHFWGCVPFKVAMSVWPVEQVLLPRGAFFKTRRVKFLKYVASLQQGLCLQQVQQAICNSKDNLTMAHKDIFVLVS